MINFRPITYTMAETLCAVIQKRGRVDEDRTVQVLLRRALLERAEDTKRKFRITQYGREVLAQHLYNRNDGSVQPSVVSICYFWKDFYGWHAELHYADDPVPQRLTWTQPLGESYQALQFILRDLTRSRYFLLACCPENHQPVEGE